MRPGPGLPQAYVDLLKDYDREEKRRKVRRLSVSQESPCSRDSPQDVISPRMAHAASIGPQLVLEESSEDEWDDVSLEHEDEEGDEEVAVNSVNISFNAPAASTRKTESLPRSFKLQVHASCLALLFIHTYIRNSWTQLPQLRSGLRDQLPSVFLQHLVPPTHLSETLKTSNLLSGLRQVARWWMGRFSVSTPGLYTVGWAEFEHDDRPVEGPVSQLEFIARILQHRGSRDDLEQGFCALLRALDFDCRLVCSLQPPEFNAHAAKKKRTDNSPPIYWTEVWNPYNKAWIIVDPISQTVEIQSRQNLTFFEPVQADQGNILRYCIAWYNDGTCRDVTVKYSSKYNARTRKKRMDIIPKYARMYSRILNRFAHSISSPRDIWELKDLARREKAEGMPNRIQDFVGHPFYCLEFQLKQTEILDPKTSCGVLRISDQVVPVYPRKNVKTCKSAQTWYRQGRTLKMGVQPRLSRSKKNKLTGEEEKTPLYSFDQTELYVPKPIGDDLIVPKSKFKTIDVFTRSMIPKGGVHLKHALAKVAAQLFNIDFANAVVGVSFDRASVKSKYEGIVVAKQFAPIIFDGIREIERQSRKEAKIAERDRILGLWSKVFVAAQIRRRIDGDYKDIKDKEPWPTHVLPNSFELEDETASEAESEPQPEPEELHVAAAKPEKVAPAPAPSTYSVPINDLIYSQPRESSTASPAPPPAPTRQLDEDEDDLMLDGLNESDLEG